MRWVMPSPGTTAFVQCKNIDCAAGKSAYFGSWKLRMRTGATHRYAAPMTGDADNPVSGLDLIMTEHSLWRLSRAFQHAINERHFDDLSPLLDDDIDWAIYGPIDMFPFFGARVGKDAVVDVVKHISDNFRIRRFEREAVMLEPEAASTMLRCSLTALDTNKPITMRLAHFAQFRAGKLLRLRVLLDTFDLVEQTLGRPINLPKIGSFA
jgi:ketosteroid isomerase-like protein